MTPLPVSIALDILVRIGADESGIPDLEHGGGNRPVIHFRHMPDGVPIPLGLTVDVATVGALALAGAVSASLRREGQSKRKVASLAYSLEIKIEASAPRTGPQRFINCEAWRKDACA